MDDKGIKIAFGCAGEGRGHASRVIALSEVLMKEFAIRVFAPPTVSDFIGQNLPDIDIEEIPSICFHREDHIIDYGKTLVKNLPLLGSLSAEVNRVCSIIEEEDIAVLISDFEPVTAVAAERLKIPVLNLNHPGVVLRYFSIMPDALAAKLAARIMMPARGVNLITSFYGGDIGPIIRKGVKEKISRKGSHYCVYAKPGSREKLLEALKFFPGEDFLVFPNREVDFAEALAGCRGIIGPAGHQMLSEALYLRKPVLAFPEKMQFEQRLNALMLEKSGWGMRGSIDTAADSIGKFLSAADNFPLFSRFPPGFVFEDCTEKAADIISRIAARAAKQTIKPALIRPA
jgi:uncharacterized protein (TIGR00661 family)